MAPKYLSTTHHLESQMVRTPQVLPVQSVAALLLGHESYPQLLLLLLKPAGK